MIAYDNKGNPIAQASKILLEQKLYTASELRKIVTQHEKEMKKSRT